MDLSFKIEFFNLVQKSCLPGVWSKGVAIVRIGSVFTDQIQEEEMRFRVCTPDCPVSSKVTLWPDDEDWFCDACDTTDRSRVCAHVAAVVIFLKHGSKNKHESKSYSCQLNYRFSRADGKLFFERWIVQGEKTEHRLSGSLVSFIGGVRSGRIQSLSVAAVQSDFAVDAILVSEGLGWGQGKEEMDRRVWILLFKALAGCSNISLDGHAVTVSSKAVQFRACLLDEGSGFRLRMENDPSVTEVFKNGAVLCGSVLKGIEAFPLRSDEKSILAGEGKVFFKNEVKTLVTEIIPSLKKKIHVNIMTERLPCVGRVTPKIIIDVEKIGNSEGIYVTPRITYESGNQNEILVSDPIEEQKLLRQLKHELQLVPGQRVQFHGESAVDFVYRLDKWEAYGNGLEEFSINGTLVPKMNLEFEKFDFVFQVAGQERMADPSRVLLAWRQNLSYVPLIGGGWARLPLNWLEKYGERIQSIINAKSLQESFPSFLLPQAQALCDELGQTVSKPVRQFNDGLENLDIIEEVDLPRDLSVVPRKYQKEGINWLCFLRQGQVGALLADDMGLGKTLQALCAIQGRTLVVAPTSILHSWVEQIRQFRPSLTYYVYYGNNRVLNSRADITITSYAILRLDKDYLTEENWDSIILDEAQVIKNPDSQITRAVHALQANFRVALTGTPVENRLEDLWSQFQFLNPGLLGSLESFQDQYVFVGEKEREAAVQRLRQRVRPFILRRLKKDVAPELPPRTEKVLYSELNQDEREVYEAILTSTRREVCEKLEAGGSIFAALELLLRLRQVCCHVSLIPGQTSQESSKLDLLFETLHDSIESGHRALVFSQWTSYLDLIEYRLKQQGVRFSRLDGTTRNRQQVVEEFQKDSGPSVMLISLKAGGVGLTLTAADHIFIMDPWWNPAVEDQAADRSHRIGQTQAVLIHRLVAQGTIEEKILAFKKAKQEVAESILQGTASAASVSREDILALLS